MPDLKKLITLEALQAALPSWLKSSSKPSYTQDEVPDGTTYKRVAQTEKNAWSGKQNALTTTQMNAVNSGIDSSKVSQISTNQANILYTIDTGVKNWIPMSSNVLLYNGLSITRTPNGIQISGTSTKTFSLLLTGSAIEQQTSDPAYYDIYSKLPDSVNLSGAPDNQNKNRIIVALYLGTTWVYSFSSQTAMPVDLSNYTYDRWYAYIPIAYGESYSGTWKPFLKDSSITDNTFVPGSLPNSDLTQLESEDRAALADQVDSGAKNLGKYNTSMPSWSGATITVTDDGITVSGTATGTYTADIIPVNIATTTEPYVFAFYGSKSGFNVMLQWKDTTSHYNPFTENTRVMIIPAGCKIDKVYMQRQTAEAATVSGNFKVMWCTLTDWNASHNYVPYRPSWDLVSKLAVPIIIEKQVLIANSLIDTGVTYTLPANNYYRITAYQKYNNNAPATIAIVNNQNTNPLADTGVYAITETPYPESSYMRALSASTIVKTGSTTETLYVFAKARGSTAKNNIIALVIEPLN